MEIKNPARFREQGLEIFCLWLDDFLLLDRGISHRITRDATTARRDNAKRISFPVLNCRGRFHQRGDDGCEREIGQALSGCEKLNLFAAIPDYFAASNAELTDAGSSCATGF